MNYDSTGRRLLLRVLQIHTATEVGRMCRVQQPVVSKWALGYQRPSERVRFVLETRYDIPHWSWYQVVESSSAA